MYSFSIEIIYLPGNFFLLYMNGPCNIDVMKGYWIHPRWFFKGLEILTLKCIVHCRSSINTCKRCFSNRDGMVKRLPCSLDDPFIKAEWELAYSVPQDQELWRRQGLFSPFPFFVELLCHRLTLVFKDFHKTWDITHKYVIKCTTEKM